MAESTLSTFVASDGENIAIQDWPLDNPQSARAWVLIVHGLTEHAGRYEGLARSLNAWGFAVRSYDQYGHGESGGRRGSLPTDNRLIDDLADVLQSTHARMPAGMPLVLLGHSLGGLVAARFVTLYPQAAQGLVLSSPALDIGLSQFQKFCLAAMVRLAPDLTLPARIDAKWLTHDAQAVRAYLSDPLVHGRLSARLVQFIVSAGAVTLAQASQWSLPTLLLYAGTDRIVNPQGSRAWAAVAPPGIVSVQCFEALYHEIFHEQDSTAVMAALREWLNVRF